MPFLSYLWVGSRKTLEVDVSGSLSDIALLTQAGYLTIKAPEPGETFLLDYPNLEVRRSMARLYAEQLLDGRIPGQVGAGPIVETLSEGSLEFVVFVLNRFLSAINYHKHPVKDVLPCEPMCRSILRRQG